MSRGTCLQVMILYNQPTGYTTWIIHVDYIAVCWEDAMDCHTDSMLCAHWVEVVIRMPCVHYCQIVNMSAIKQQTAV